MAHEYSSLRFPRRRRDRIGLPLAFAAAFAAVGIDPLDDSMLHAGMLVLGVCVGASGWWLSLTTSVHLMHHKLSDAQLLWINRVSGVMLIGFALVMLGSLL